MHSIHAVAVVALPVTTHRQRTDYGQCLTPRLRAVQGLSIFGNGFMSKFEAASCPDPLLENITLVDTPGLPAAEAILDKRHNGRVCNH